MSNNNKKGFSGLSNIETKVGDISLARASETEPQSKRASAPESARDTRPPISSIPVEEPTPIFDFFKK